jgi:ferrochelatase
VLEWIENTEADITLSIIDDWQDRPAYIELLRQRIDAAFEQFDKTASPKLIFSAHAVPQKLAASGDPYVARIKETSALAGDGYDYLLTFQSRTGPVAWVGPDTLKTVRSLARKGVTDMIIIPVSFVSDHIETLYEIDIELKEAALKAGVRNFVRIESFNDDPRFGDMLADLVEEKISSE